MPRDLTAAQRRNLYQRRSGDPLLWLATFRHADLSKPLNIVRNAEDVVSQGVTFHKGWFDLEEPVDDGNPPKGRMSIPNIDLEFSRLLLRIRGAVRVRLRSILASSPDTVLDNYDFLYLRDISGDDAAISGTLGPWLIANEPWPARSGTKPRFPGVWL